MKKIGVFDIDGTVYTHTLTFSVAEELLESPKFEREKEEVDSARKIWKERGSTESYWVYNIIILETFEKILPLVSPLEMNTAIQKVLSEQGAFCYAYTTALIQQLKQEGRLLIAISGSIKNIVEPFALSRGFDVVISSELELVDGAFTGKRASQTNKNKDQLLRDIVEKHGATLEDSIGVGDTHRDISLLSVVEHPIAFNPNAALYDEAAKCGWKIVLERKNMVYELVKGAEGYVVEEARPIRSDGNQEHLR